MQSSRQHKCPQCQQPARWAENPDRPFCSERCRLVDLGAWFEGNYRLPTDTLGDVAENSEEVS